jgi:hypothetical protein
MITNHFFYLYPNYRTFLAKRLYEHRKSRGGDKKEAAKLNEYIGVVERSLQAAELVAAAAAPVSPAAAPAAPAPTIRGRASAADTQLDLRKHREFRMHEAGVREILHVTNLTWGNVSVGMSVMIPLDINSTAQTLRYKPHEAVVAFFDIDTDTSTNSGSGSGSGVSSELWGFLDRPPTHATCPGRYADEQLSVHPGVLQLAQQALGYLSAVLCSGGGDTTISDDIPLTDAHNATNASTTSASTSTATPIATPTSATPTATPTSATTTTSIRLVGHSIGGAVAAVSAMLLEGSLRGPLPPLRPGGGEGEISTEGSIPLSGEGPTTGREQRERRERRERRLVEEILERYRERGCVRCFTLASPPCVSRGVVPQYITSVVLGEDVVTRTTEASITRVATELVKQLKKGKSKYLKYDDTTKTKDENRKIPKLGRISAKKKGLFGSMNGLKSVIALPLRSVRRSVGSLGGVVSLGATGLRRYSEGSVNDIESLNVPGRVFYLKNENIHKYIGGEREKAGTKVKQLFIHWNII